MSKSELRNALIGNHMISLNSFRADIEDGFIKHKHLEEFADDLDAFLETLLTMALKNNGISVTEAKKLIDNLANDKKGGSTSHDSSLEEKKGGFLTDKQVSYGTPVAYREMGSPVVAYTLGRSFIDIVIQNQRNPNDYHVYHYDANVIGNYNLTMLTNAAQDQKDLYHYIERVIIPTFRGEIERWKVLPDNPVYQYCR